MGVASVLRRAASVLRRTPLHPQWQVLRIERERRGQIAAVARGLVLDVGCADQWVAAALPAGCRYVSVDYPATAAGLYGTRPQVYGDGRRLPIATAVADTVLLLDVLEHIPQPEQVIAELARVLAPGGRLVLSVPFMYPVHDAPFDFQRYTPDGLADVVARAGLATESRGSDERPLETAAMFTNIALAGGVLDAIRRRHPAALLVVIVPPIVLVVNVLAWLLSRLLPRSTFMARSNWLVASKP